MKPGRILITFMFCLFCQAVWAEDMRVQVIESESKKAMIIDKAMAEKKSAQTEAEKSRQRILKDKHALTDTITRLKAQNRTIKKENQTLEESLTTLGKKETQLKTSFEEMRAVVSELIGLVRINARDLEALIHQSPQTAFDPDRANPLQTILKQTKFPGLKDIQNMVDLVFQEIQLSGEVRIQNSAMVDRSGEEVPADILTLGNFTAAYRLSSETGFLIYSDKSRRMFALSKLPAYRMKNNIKDYMIGKSEVVPIDISRGAALRQLTHRLSLTDQITKGGPIVWPILLILILATGIIIERGIVLSRKNMDADGFMTKICDLIQKDEYDACTTLCNDIKTKPIVNVIRSGLNMRDKELKDIENTLQEAILREIPPLERFLSTLGMLAAIAPLLGLLGTVTGMINTFHVITYAGTGDPRMMSGGISEALVTTMLGLSVAIPIMFCHTLLNRKVEDLIAKMEEKAITLINTISKSREMEECG